MNHEPNQRTLAHHYNRLRAGCCGDLHPTEDSMKTTPSKSKDHTSANSKIKECTCTHDYQDKRYGLNMRVMNPGKAHYTCTVCGRKHDK